MEEINNLDEEDEDVVIQGSALHKHLSNLGYMDFESVSVSKKADFEQKRNLHINIKNTLKHIYIKLMSFYSWITQESIVSEKQLNVILKTEVALTDHFSMMNNLLTKCNNNSKKIALQELIVTGIVLICSTCVSLCKYKTLPILFASSVICYASYIRYLRFYTNKNLTNVISLQNELLAMCKGSLKILRRDYNIKLGPETCQQFLRFLGDKMQYLQLLTNTLVEFMERVSCIYYEFSLSIVKVLPASVLNEELFTKFERDAFKIDGEINHQILMKLYHTYLLVQSEMLYLLAVAYDSNSWAQSCRRIPETKLAYIIHTLSKTLTTYKVQLSDIINAYHACKVEPIRDKVPKRAKWHDPSIQLDLASHKLQLSYSQLFSIFKDIDDCISNQETGIDKERAKMLMERLNGAFKEIDTAKSLAEFVILLLARSEFDDLRSDTPVTDGATLVTNNADLPVITDSDPEILDEVFEEYIKEEFRKPTDEDVDECLLEQQKLDKLLAKNFMSELKEALLDKQKSMSEREFRALQRTCKIITKNPTEDDACQRIDAPLPQMSSYLMQSMSTNAEQERNETTTGDSTVNTEANVSRDCRAIPPAPSMPSHRIWSTSMSNESNYEKKISCEAESIGFNQEKVHESEEVESTKMPRYKIVFNRSSMMKDENGDESLASLPQILLETQATRFAVKLPPAFLQEETFIGSGENSEDEAIDGAYDDVSDEEDNKTSQ